MLGRSLRKSILELRIPSSTLPPTFLLPSRARYFNSTTQIVEPPPHGFAIGGAPPALEIVASSPQAPTENRSPPNSSISTKKAAKPISDSIKKLLPFLLAQPNHYVTAHIHARPYLVTPGDIIRLPFCMPHVVPGDILRLNRASNIGSRDYTLKGAPYLDERIFECRARVMGTESEPLRILEKKKRRNRRVKTVRSAHKFTVLRISELRVKSLEELEELEG